MRSWKLFLSLFLIVILSSFGRAGAETPPEWRDRPELTAIFAEAGLDGTFVLYDVHENQLVGYNHGRAEKRYLPASTFKIPNSLIGLSVGAVASVDEVLPYGGRPQPVKAWEKDMSLREAIKISNVPIYQELARRIGLERMRTELARLNYGNGEIGEKVDTFWLEGPLEISAVEQARFLARLAGGTLPLPAEAQAAVRDITLQDQGPGWALHAKTGAAMRRKPGIGWWVGWVEKDDRVYAFALNIDLEDFDRDTPKRLELGRACLEQLGILEPAAK